MEEKKVVEFLVKYRDLCNEYGLTIKGLWDEEVGVCPQKISPLLTYKFPISSMTEVCWETKIDWEENENDVWPTFKLVPEKIED